MRKFLISAAVATSALTAVATPAAAQYYPQQGYAQPSYGYTQGYGYNQGYQARGDGRVLIARVDRVRLQIRELEGRNALSRREVRGLDREAVQLRYQVQRLAYNGVDQRERYVVEQRLVRLEQRVRYNANDRNGRYEGRGNGFGNQSPYVGQEGRWQDRDGDWHDRGERRDRND